MEVHKIHSAESLKDSIAHLELRHRIESAELKEDLKRVREDVHELYEKVAPVGRVISNVCKFLVMPEMKENAVNTMITGTTNFLANKFVAGNSGNPMKKILANVIKFGILSLASKREEILKSVLSNGARFIREKFRDGKRGLRHLVN